MNFDLSLVLVILAAVSGSIWLIDYLLLSKPRSNELSQFLAKQGISNEDFQLYANSLDENSKPEKSPPQNAKTAGQKIILEQAQLTYRAPLPVEYAKSFFPILFVVLILRSFLFEPFQIPSGSMVPTLNIGDFIVVNKFAYGLRLPITGTKILNIGEPKRGDVMVFTPPHDPRHFIKRVIGLPGDHVRYADNIVYINNEALPQNEGDILSGKGVKLSLETLDGLTHSIHTDSPQPFRSSSQWIDSAGTLQTKWLEPQGMIIPEDQYFMMGDNRDHSEDSRYWGPASDAKIVGKAVAVWMHKEPDWHLPTFRQNRLIKNTQ